MLRIGTYAPEFELKLHTGLRFNLGDQLGVKNVVLYFYPRDYTWGCTKEGCLFADHIREIESMDAILLGVNGDTIEHHRKFAAEYQFPFPLASDPRLEVCRNYRALWLGSKAVRRVTYVIDKRRVIRGVAHHELLIDRHWSYVKRILGQIRNEEATKVYNKKAWDL